MIIENNDSTYGFFLNILFACTTNNKTALFFEHERLKRNLICLRHPSCLYTSSNRSIKTLLRYCNRNRMKEIENRKKTNEDKEYSPTNQERLLIYRTSHFWFRIFFDFYFFV